MIIIGVDYGDVRTGISVCDKSETLASPVCVITQRNQAKLIEEINKICNEYKPELIVVGLPKNMDGSIGFRGEHCIQFSNDLSSFTNIPCVMQDERLTTVSAHNVLNTTNTRGKKRKDVIDQVASTMILQDYIDKKKKRGEQ